MGQRTPIYKPLQLKKKVQPKVEKNKTHQSRRDNKRSIVMELLATGTVVPLVKLSAILKRKVVTIRRHGGIQIDKTKV